MLYSAGKPVNIAWSSRGRVFFRSLPCYSCLQDLNRYCERNMSTAHSASFRKWTYQKLRAHIFAELWSQSLETPVSLSKKLQARADIRQVMSTVDLSMQLRLWTCAYRNVLACKQGQDTPSVGPKDHTAPIKLLRAEQLQDLLEGCCLASTHNSRAFPRIQSRADPRTRGIQALFEPQPRQAHESPKVFRHAPDLQTVPFEEEVLQLRQSLAHALREAARHERHERVGKQRQEEQTIHWTESQLQSAAQKVDTEELIFAYQMVLEKQAADEGTISATAWARVVKVLQEALALRNQSPPRASTIAESGSLH